MNLKKQTLILGALLLSVSTLQARTWYVSNEKGSDRNNATQNAPFKTISKAARLAISGDTILISEGVYRENVSPANGGISKDTPIVYMPVEGEKVEIKGSEIIEGWQADKSLKGIYKCSVNNEIFGDFNPFDVNIYGDWYLGDKDLHLGDLYLDGKNLKEVISKDQLSELPNTWFVDVYDDETIIYANFDGANPQKGITEINVRPTCFFPERTGVNYIVVKGLHFSQASPQWAPPTAEQLGMVGPNWSKGWIIEDCVVSQSKCVGISIGKGSASGQNLNTLTLGKMPYVKNGFNREIETIFKAYDLGWSREDIGSHQILNNKIFDCNQAGIVGHLGCIFSEIRGNEIYNINTDESYKGHETGGIKLHAAIDVVLDNNLIYNARRGIWLDWQAQGTQVCNNIMYDCISEDLFFEVSHGPTLVYNNVLLSKRAVLLDAQGVAFFNNTMKGDIIQRSSAPRYTPYHAPHSTKIRGLFNNPGGDVRFYNNLFISSLASTNKPAGLSKFDRFPVCGPDMSAGLNIIDMLKFEFPIWTKGNVYFNGAPAYVNEVDGVTSNQSADITFERKADNSIYVTITADPAILNKAKTTPVNTEILGRTIISEQIFENKDETPFSLTKDILGNPRNVSSPAVGAFENVTGGRVW